MASDWFFSVPTESSIRFGLGAIKGISRSLVDSLMRTRREEGPFRDIFDFARRVPEVNQKLFESLIKAGAFDSIDPRRGLLMANVSDAIQYSKSQQEHMGQGALFGEEVETPVLSKSAPEWSLITALAEEKSVYGFWVSGHPYDAFRRLVPMLGSRRLLDLLPAKAEMQLCGLVAEARQVVGKRGAFGIVSIDDGTAQLDALSPLAVLGRGYSIVRVGDGGVVKSVEQAQIGQALDVTVSDGVIECSVSGVWRADEDGPIGKES